MRILICSINTKFIHSSLAPWYLKAHLEENSEYKAEILETTINNRLEYILEKILEFNADFICFSTYIWNISITEKLINLIHIVSPNTKIILGGPEASYNFQNLMNNQKNIDFIIVSEGERAFTSLIKGDDKSSIAGLVYRDGDIILHNPPENFNDTPINPYTDEYFSKLNNRIAYFESSRGCPYTCSFCLSGRRQDVRFFELNKVALERLIKSGTKTIKFVDRTFNCHKKRTYEILKYLIGLYNTEPFDVCFHFEIAAEILDEHTLELLKAAPIGLFQFEAGLQSFNQSTLEAVYRYSNTKILTENLIKIMECKNSHLHIDLIAGLPYEDFNSFGNSFNMAYAIKPHMLQLGFLKILYGTRLKDEHKSIKHSPYPPYEILKSDWLSYDEILKLKRAEDVLDKVYNSGRFIKTLDFVFQNIDISPFDLFVNIGGYINDLNIVGAISLDNYTHILYDYFTKVLNLCNIRDIMAFDLISTKNKLPEFLKVYISDNKFINKKILNGDFDTEHCEFSKLLKSGNLSFIITNTEIILADYTRLDRINNRYETTILKRPVYE